MVIVAGSGRVPVAGVTDSQFPPDAVAALIVTDPMPVIETVAVAGREFDGNTWMTLAGFVVTVCAAQQVPMNTQIRWRTRFTLGIRRSSCLRSGHRRPVQTNMSHRRGSPRGSYWSEPRD